MDLSKTFTRKFLAPDTDMGDPEQIRAAYARLAEMPVDTKEQAAEWSAAWDEVSAAISQVKSKAYFATTRDTRDEKAEAEFKRLAQEVIPLSHELDEKAKRRFLSFPEEWVPQELKIARTNAQWAVDLFREENLPLITEIINLETEYDKISGGWETEYDGKKVTPQQLNPYLESPDREVRESAWRAKTGMHLADYDKLNDLFDKMLEVREKIAANAGFSDYAEFQYKNYARLSYNSEDSANFRQAIAEYVVPAVNDIFKRRADKLGLDPIRPWDLKANADGEKPPKVYDDIPDLKDKAARVMGSIDPQFAEAFRLMDSKGYLDLDNRPGKAPGAYMSEFAEERIAMIFGNAVGTVRDFDTLIHEGGHAMHGFLSRELPYHAREVPMEFAEVASMSLELLARPYLDIVFGEKDRERIGITQLEETLIFLPFMAEIDEFQHWVYADPAGKDAEARADFWRQLDKKYRPYINYNGLEKEQSLGWQYPHVFTVPLYYIEYGVAQIGALQIYLRSLKEYDTAVADYKHGLSLGTTVGLPELFETSGAKLVLKHPEIMESLIGDIMKHIGY